MDTITFADFKKLDIKIGTIITAEKVPDADKLVKLIIDIGSEKRQIMAGIAQFFPDLTTLIGKQIPILINLEPKILRGFESNGMMLVADTEGRPILLHPAEPVPVGTIVR